MYSPILTNKLLGAMSYNRMITIMMMIMNYLDTMSCSDNPLVGDQSCSTFVLELPTFVLPEGHLPWPLCITGHIAANNTTISDKLPSTDLTVVRVGVECIKGSCSSFSSTDIIVIKRNINLWCILTNVVSKTNIE